MNVENMQSSNGNTVPNQYLIRTDRGIYFQSYNSIIAYKDYSTSQVYLDCKYYNYSKTTSKYRNMFLGETTKEIESKIKNGAYMLVDLNKGGIE